jgi:hypothetical protein
LSCACAPRVVLKGKGVGVWGGEGGGARSLRRVALRCCSPGGFAQRGRLVFLRLGALGLPWDRGAGRDTTLAPPSPHQGGRASRGVMRLPAKLSDTWTDHHTPRGGRGGGGHRPLAPAQGNLYFTSLEPISWGGGSTPRVFACRPREEGGGPPPSLLPLSKGASHSWGGGQARGGTPPPAR